MDNSLASQSDAGSVKYDDKCFLISILALFVISAYFLLRCPVYVTDTDLWYHLSGGRFLIENREISNSTFFSFIEPSREGINYYWLFQAIVYLIHSCCGYYGLVFFRAIFFVGTVYLVFRFFISGNNRNVVKKWAVLILIVFYTLAILKRDINIRPHLISYFMICMFLYILEQRRDKIWILPLASIIWFNIHGIMFPVTFLILLAYLVDMYVDNKRQLKRYSDCGPLQRWSIIASLFCVLLTPYGIKLLETPFLQANLQHLYVEELIPLSVFQLFSLRLFPLKEAPGSFHVLLVVLSAIFFFLLVLKRKITTGRILLFFGAAFLLTKHNRFMYEYILLAIPIISDGIGLYSIKNEKRTIGFLLYITAVVIFLVILISIFIPRERYPFSRVGLPAGNIEFLNYVNTGGNILNTASYGGYWQWGLRREYKIYADMQMVFFRDTDIFIGMNAFRDKTVFDYILSKYDVSYLAIPSNLKEAAVILKQYSEYQPVFFDESSILFANKKIIPEIVEKYQLKAIDPFSIGDIDYVNMDEQKMNEILDETTKIHQIDKDGLINSGIICNILIQQNKNERALELANHIIDLYPGNFHGYALKAQVMFKKEQYDESVKYNKMALKRGDNLLIRSAQRNLYLSYLKLKEYSKAFKTISDYVNPFKTNTSPEDIFELGQAAALAGEKAKARIFLDLAEIKNPQDNKGLRQKINKVKEIYGDKHLTEGM